MCGTCSMHGNINNALEVLVGKIPVRRLSRRWEDIINMDLT
jgi:hypothetical protein